MVCVIYVWGDNKMVCVIYVWGDNKVVCAIYVWGIVRWCVLSMCGG